jgi:photosystem II stability/assembly factor-like uncharacterized protein
VHLAGAVVRRSVVARLAAGIVATLVVGLTLSACTGSHANPALRAWAVGAGGVILATSDGGVHWIAQHSGTTDTLNGVAFADAQHGWVVGGQPFSGVILATTDGGTHWAKQLTHPGIPFQDVVCTDSTHAWVAGHGINSAVTMATSDGGRTWVTQQSGDKAVKDLVFADASHGWALGYLPRGILATSDGGIHWRVQLAANAAHGWAVGGHWRSARPSAVVWSTSDGGLNWRELGGPLQEMNILQAVAASDPRHVVVAGDGMWFSTDGGKHWTTCTVTAAGETGPAVGGASGFAFSDATHGWAAAGGILATSDGGATWHRQVKQPASPDHYIRAVACLRQVAATTTEP